MEHNIATGVDDAVKGPTQNSKTHFFRKVVLQVTTANNIKKVSHVIDIIRDDVP